MAENQGEPALAVFLRETADAWNAEIESLLYVTDTQLRATWESTVITSDLRRPTNAGAIQAAAGAVTLKNHRAGRRTFAVAEIVSPDALALVRFGLRAADDPRIVNTVRVIDHLLKVETPHGHVLASLQPGWIRRTR